MINIELIKTIPLFSDLDKDELSLISSILTQRTYTVGEQIIHESDCGHSIYIIQKGSVKITKTVRHGQRQILDTLREKDFFGELSFLNGKLHTASAEAITDTEILVLKREDFDKLVEKDTKLGYKVLQKLTLQIIKILRKMDELFIEMINYMSGGGKV